MAETPENLGQLVAVHAIAPAYLQRAVFVVVLSFLFFLAMMFAYYIRQSTVYFLLASGFLVIYLITMFSFVMQRRSHVEVFENGFKYKKNRVLWSDVIEVVDVGEAVLKTGKRVMLPKTLSDLEGLLRHIRAKTHVNP